MALKIILCVLLLSGTGTHVFRLLVTEPGTPTLTGTDKAASTRSPAISVNASAGADQNKWMPDNTATLNASGSKGAGTLTYAWSRISGPRAGEGLLSAANIENPTILNLGVGTFRYRVLVSNGSSSDADTVVIRGYAQRSPPCATGKPVKYTAVRSGTQIFYTNVMASFPALKGGDTIAIPDGHYTLIQLQNIVGDSCRPIVIINEGGLVSVTNQIRLYDARYFKFTGTGSGAPVIDGVKYGFYGHDFGGSGLLVTNQSSDYIVENCRFKNVVNGVFSKLQVKVTDALSYTPNWEYRNAEYRKIRTDSTKGEAFYIGHTLTPSPCSAGNLMPVRFRRLKVHDNRIHYAGWDGIQVSLAGDSCLVYNNVITDYGWRNRSSQKAGIIFGGYSTGRIWNNSIHRGTGSGIAIFGYDGPIKVYNNTLDSCGTWVGHPIADPSDKDYQTDFKARSADYHPDRSIYVNDNVSACLRDYPLNPLFIWITNNCITNVSGIAGGAAIRNNNANRNTVPGVISGNTIHDPSGRALTDLIKSYAGDAISKNRLGRCLRKPRNNLQVASAGPRRTISPTTLQQRPVPLAARLR